MNHGGEERYGAPPHPIVYHRLSVFSQRLLRVLSGNAFTMGL